MGYYSDPTANQALGNINREFTKQQKTANRLLKLYESGKLSEEEFDKACSQFKGIFKYVPYSAVENKLNKDNKSA